MSHRDTLRNIDLDVTRLVSTPTKGLKPSQKADIFESIDSLRQQLAKVLKEDDTLKYSADRTLKRLTEYEDGLDAVDSAPPAAPIPDGGGIDDLPPEPGAGGEPDDEGATIAAAADKLEQLGSEHGDEEATQLAGDLNAIADTMQGDAAPPDDLGGDMPPPDPAAAPGGDMPPMERKLRAWGKRLIERARRVATKLRRVTSQHERLAVATSTVVERYRALKKNVEEGTVPARRRGEGGGPGQPTLEEYAVASRELAERYNRDMVEMGLLLMQAKRPELYEAHKAELSKARSWKRFTAMSESLVRKAGGTPASVAEGANRGSSAQPPKGTTPKAPAAPAKGQQQVNEDVHPAVAMASRARSRHTIAG